MDGSTASLAARPVAADRSWRPPPFCRLSWTSERARDAWEARLHAARDALEDLAVLRSVEDGQKRLIFVRSASLDRLADLARAGRVGMRSLALPERPDDVAAGRRGRVALAIGGDPIADVAPAPEDEDPVWRIANATPGASPLETGLGLAVAGEWASNPLLAPLGLAAAPPWPESFASAAADAEGDALLSAAARHGREAPIADLREALSWPVSWTALHGAAEVKTPLFRYIRDTVPTRERLTVLRLGAAMPAEAAHGLGFPFSARIRRKVAP